MVSSATQLPYTPLPPPIQVPRPSLAGDRQRNKLVQSVDEITRNYKNSLERKAIRLNSPTAAVAGDEERGKVRMLPSDMPAVAGVAKGVARGGGGAGLNKEYGLDGQLTNWRRFQEGDTAGGVGADRRAPGSSSKNKKPGVETESTPQIIPPTVSVRGSTDGLDDLPPTMTALPNPPPTLFENGSVLNGLKNKNGSAIFSTVWDNFWENTKKMMGFSPNCLHGGHKNLRGDCVCPQYYVGDRCESIVCVNNGTRSRTSILNLSEDTCVCPSPDFITGKHCEVVRCHNGGKDLGNGSCSCVDGWYSGQFCQFYTSSWLVAVGLPLLGIAMIIICCVVCRLDLCPRRSSRRERRSRRRHQHQAQHQRPTPGRQQPQGHRSSRLSNQVNNLDMLSHDQALIMQENLLNEGMIRQLNGRQYVVRLEEIPNFNPRLMAQAMEPSGMNIPLSSAAFKPMEPPPPYEQAVLRCPSLTQTTTILPPNYFPPTQTTGQDRESGDQQNEEQSHQPPPPRFRPPDPP